MKINNCKFFASTCELKQHWLWYTAASQTRSEDINSVYRLLTDYLQAVIDVEPLWLWLYWAQSPSGGRYAQIYKLLCSPRRPSVLPSQCKSPMRIDAGSISTGRWKNGLLPVSDCAPHALMPLLSAASAEPNSSRSRERVDNFIHRTSLVVFRAYSE